MRVGKTISSYVNVLNIIDFMGIKKIVIYCKDEESVVAACNNFKNIISRYYQYSLRVLKEDKHSILFNDGSKIYFTNDMEYKDHSSSTRILFKGKVHKLLFSANNSKIACHDLFVGAK